MLNLKFTYKQSSEFKGSNKNCVKPHSLSFFNSITAVWATIFLTEEKRIWREELKNWETENNGAEA